MTVRHFATRSPGLLAILLLASVCALPARAQQNLAAGRPVTFAPTPGYGLTKKGGTDTTDLTDGKHSTRSDNKLWFDSAAVGWSYAGLARMALDVGAAGPVNVGSVSMRLQGGSPQPGISFPCLVRVLVSEDGDTWRLAGEYSHYKADPYEDRRTFGVPAETGQAWVHNLTIPVNVSGVRHVGMELYCTAYTISDELVVTGAGGDGPLRQTGLLPAVAFSVTRPMPYFHRPTLLVPANVNLPTPIGLTAPDGLKKRPMETAIDLPEGLAFRGGSLLGTKTAEAKTEKLPDGYTRYRFPWAGNGAPKSNKVAGRVYLRADKAGVKGTIRYGLSWDGGQLTMFEQPFTTADIPEAPQPKLLDSTFAWMSLGQTMTWPEAMAAYRHIGITAVPLFARYTDLDDPEVKATLESFRKAGFKVHNIDSPFHHMLRQHKGEKEMYAQFADGTVGARMCPSYRGKFYKGEVNRLATQCAAADADILDMDIELWSWRGPTDSEKCTRCQTAFKASGLKTWDQWKLAQGMEMMTDLVTAVREAKKQAGQGPIEIGVYDFNVGHNYQHVWPVGKLYPKLLDSSQTSTYTALEPYHVALLGDVVRADRKRLPATDTRPWICPGDAGTFTGEMFEYAMLECFANGARGMRFWSNRTWDADLLAAYARVMRQVVPVERVIVRGNLVENIKADPGVRISGMQHQGETFLLLNAMPVRTTEPMVPRDVTLTAQATKALEVTNLADGKSLGRFAPQGNTVTIKLRVDKVLPLHLEPVD